MSGYELEHNIKEEQKPSGKPRRPDLSTFFSTLELVDTSGERTPHNNSNAVPEPASVAAAHRTLANAFLAMLQESGSNSLLDGMIQELVDNSEHPPEKVDGVPDSFLHDLERVKKDRLEGKDCPICGNPFLDDQYPLVVRLPCHPDHLFDLECIQPWLKLHPTCPLDRKVVWKKKDPPPPPKDDEDDGEYDEMYA